MSIGSKLGSIAILLLFPALAWAFDNGISGHNRNGLSLVRNQASALAPVNTVAPAVSGTATVGSVLSSTTGAWTNSPTGYAYQWQRGGVNIPGATSSTYTTVTADGGTSVSCNVTATNATGSATTASNALAIASGAAAWTPALLPGLVAWYDAQNAASITLNGSTVAQWNDGSGNAYNATQGTAAKQPTYNAIGLNGLPALQFNGTTNYMSANVPAGKFPAAIFQGIVFNTSNANTMMGIQRTIGVLGAGITRFANYLNMGDGSSQQSVATLPAMSNYLTPSLVEFLYDDSVKTGSEWKNGAAPTSATFTHAYGDAATTGYIGSRIDLPGAYYLNGPVGEIVASSGITTLNRQYLEGYLAWKWGLSGLLPAGHPFKSGPPDTNGNPMAVPPLLTGAESDGTNILGSLSANGASLTAAPTIVAPDGTTGGVQLFKEDTSAGVHRVYSSSGNSLTMTVSAYVKANTRQYFQLMPSIAGAAGGPTFDVLNGLVTTLSTVPSGYTVNAVSCTPAANGFFKCSAQITYSSAMGFQLFGLASNATTGSYTGDGASGLYVWRLKATIP